MSFTSRNALRLAAVAASLAITAVTVGHAVQNAEPATPDFTEKQVNSGEEVYVNHCQQCHGENLKGQRAPALVGEAFVNSWLSGEQLEALHTKISQQMPLNNPGSLSEQQYLDVTAYVLAQNGYEPTGEALTTENLEVELQPPAKDDPAEGDAEEGSEDDAGQEGEEQEGSGG